MNSDRLRHSGATVFSRTAIAILTIAGGSLGTVVHAQNQKSSESPPPQSIRVNVKPGESRENRSAKVERRKENYLGVFANAFAEPEARPRTSLLSSGQGILIGGVLPDSPAAAAGLRKGDVLAEYDEQKLFKVQQLRQLIVDDETGKKVTLKVVRDGKLETVKVKLDQRIVSVNGDSRSATVLRIRGDRKILGGKELVIAPPTDRNATDKDHTLAIRNDRLSLVMTSHDGKQFQLEVTYYNHKGIPSIKKLRGTAAEIHSQSAKLPVQVRKRVAESIGRIGENTAKGQPSFRFQIQPVIHESQRHLRLRLQQRGDGKGAIRIFELDISAGEFEADVVKLLKSGPLEQELKQLPPEIRKRVESTLRKAKIPEPKVRVQQSQ